jgi:hypothetical protein
MRSIAKIRRQEAAGNGGFPEQDIVAAGTESEKTIEGLEVTGKSAYFYQCCSTF